MAISANDIRKGMVILHEGSPVRVMEFHHHTPGNLRAMVKEALILWPVAWLAMRVAYRRRPL